MTVLVKLEDGKESRYHIDHVIEEIMMSQMVERDDHVSGARLRGHWAH